MKIVVVEDEVSIRNGLVAMLPKLDPEYELVGTAQDGKEGLALVLRVHPDLLIMDIRMPEMNGLDMLEKIREGGVECHVVVLSAYSDFDYAKRAIELGIDNYLLKPIKIRELRKTLKLVEQALEQEHGREKLQEKLLSLEQIFRACILAELPVDEELNRVTSRQYGLDVRERLGLFSIWLGENYAEDVQKVVQIMELYTGRVLDYTSMVIQSVRFHMVLVILYHVGNMEKVRQRYARTVIPALMRGIREMPVVTWGESDGMKQLPEAFAACSGNRKWNISFPEGTLISPDLIEHVQTIPLKYPAKLDSQICGAVTERNREEYHRSYLQFQQSCAVGRHDPDEIRETCVRLCLSVLNFASSLGRLNSFEMSAREMFGDLSQAVSWDQIWLVMDRLYELVTARKEQENVSALVKRAKQIIEEYYNQGITLEELADRLHVSEEYLSTQLRKETGMSFTEIVRGYRIERIKELLLHSNLRLNQISDMVGYSDPKYMSKVFKETVGMLPAEFRRSKPFI
ncbi:MAG: response regulator [Clostridiales bacterium]|nr:response regulator [Clostridiales bacterium]